MQANTLLVGGSSHLELNKEISKSCGLPLFPTDIQYFPDGECRVNIKEEVAGKQVIVVQSLGRKPSQYLVETFLIADALRRAEAAKIVLACPYLAYSRQNLPEQEGTSLAARLFAYFLHEAGVSELIAMDLHAEHIPSFYDFPVEHISARKALVQEIKKETLSQKDFVIVGPDLGSAKLAGHYAEEFQSGFAVIQKRRLDARRVEMLSLIGEIKGKTVLLADDMCSTASTLVSAAKVCQEKGAKRIFACVTHGLFVEDAIKHIENSPIEKLFVSNTVALDEKVRSSHKLCVVSIADTFAASIKQAAARFK